MAEDKINHTRGAHYIKVSSALYRIKTVDVPFFYAKKSSNTH